MQKALPKVERVFFAFTNYQNKMRSENMPPLEKYSKWMAAAKKNLDDVKRDFENMGVANPFDWTPTDYGTGGSPPKRQTSTKVASKPEPIPVKVDAAPVLAKLKPKTQTSTPKIEAKPAPVPAKVEIKTQTSKKIPLSKKEKVKTPEAEVKAYLVGQAVKLSTPQVKAKRQTSLKKSLFTKGLFAKAKLTPARHV